MHYVFSLIFEILITYLLLGVISVLSMTVMTDGKDKYDPLISRLIFPQPASVFKFHLKAIEE